MTPMRILIAEDDESSGKLLHDVLASHNYEVVWAKNGKEALDLYKSAPFAVVITDIEMPAMDGTELVTRLKEINPDTVIFVSTVHKEVSLIVEVMRKGAYDYLIKPLNINELIIKVQKAFEVYELRTLKKNVEHGKVVRLENQLEWLRWKEKMENRDMSIGKSDKSLFNSLKISFTQGAGFGALITLLNIIDTSAKREGKFYLIEAELMDLVHENARMADRALKTFSDLEWIINNVLEAKLKSCSELYQELKNIRTKLRKSAALKEQKIIISDEKKIFADTHIAYNSEYLNRVFRELLINAMKFSEEKTDIIILFDIQEDTAVLQFISNPVKDEEGHTGIPSEYENIIFEPFYRISKSVFEGYGTLDFGLGLTVVDNIVSKHKGKISVSRITDHSNISREPTMKVNFIITLPLSNSNNENVISG